MIGMNGKIGNKEMSQMNGRNAIGKAAVAVFGTSRSGKDYTIDGALEILGEGTHVSPMGMIHERLGERRLSGMSEGEKKELCEGVWDDIARMCREGAVVDCHWCFPQTYGGKVLKDGYNDEKLPRREVRDAESGNVYEVVFDPARIALFDRVVYLCTDPEIIVSRFRTSEGCKRNEDATVEDVEAWEDFEIRCLQRLCDMAGVPFSMACALPEDTPGMLAAEVAMAVV